MKRYWRGLRCFSIAMAAAMVMIVVAGVVTGFLISEYLLFRSASDRLIELQEDYKNYISGVNRLLCEYGRPNGDGARAETVISNGGDEKKKGVEAADSFFPVNRDIAYLVWRAQEFAAGTPDEKAVAQAYRGGDWEAYSGYHPSSLKKQRAVRATRRKRAIMASVPAPKKRKGTVRRGKKVEGGPKLVWPINRSKFWISSYFGPRKRNDGTRGFHYGLDMAAVRGTPVVAAAPGVVIEARYSNGYGKTVVISHSKKYKTRYAHMDRVNVSVGQKVQAAAVIGKVGDTGIVRKKGKDASHLHFEVYAFGKQVDPTIFLD